MKLSTIFKVIIGSILFSTVCVKAEFEKECQEVKDLTDICKVNSDGKIDYVELYLNTITEKEIDKLLSYKTITKLKLSSINGKIFLLKNLSIKLDQ